MTRSANNDLPGAAELLALVQTSLDDDKAEDIITIDLSEQSSIADYMVIASGRSSRHVAALADHLEEKIKASGHESVPTEGKVSGDWVLMDAGDVIVHLFRPEVRIFYKLEKMWGMETPGADSDTGSDDVEIIS